MTEFGQVDPDISALTPNPDNNSAVVGHFGDKQKTTLATKNIYEV